MLSNRAKSQNDVKKATIIGLLIAVSIYIGITILTMGALSQEELKVSQKPLVDALQTVAGSSGTYLMGALAVICLLGSTIGWVVVSAEVPYQAAKSDIFPSYFAKANKNGTPVRSMTITNLMTQLFLFSTISGTILVAYKFSMIVATLAYLVPYLVSTLYQFKLVLTGETYEIMKGSRTRDGIITLLALIYSIWVIKTGTADMKTFQLGIYLYVLGFILYPLWMRKRA